MSGIDAIRPLLPERVAANIVARSDGCWEWRGHIMHDGYGRSWVGVGHGGVGILAHRLVYEALVGPIPEGLTLDHTCHNGSGCPGGITCPHRRCVNVAHLEPVTFVENVRRGNSPSAICGRKTHCLRDHPLSGDNLIIYKGARVCRECRRINNAAIAVRRRELRAA